MKRAKIGDIAEIETSKGLAYIQYCNKDKNPPKWGDFIRVLQGFYVTRPNNQEIKNLSKQPHVFQIFFNFSSFIKTDDLTLIGNFDVPEFYKEFPLFKSTSLREKFDCEEEDIQWSIFSMKEKNGKKVGKLSLEEQSKYPTPTFVPHCLEMSRTIVNPKVGNLRLC